MELCQRIGSGYGSESLKACMGCFVSAETVIKK